MYVILVYDVNAKHVRKVMKTAEKYLLHVQQSVFEGFLTESKLKRLKREIYNLIDFEVDSVIIYVHAPSGQLTKEQIGTHRPNDVCFL